MFDVKNCTKQRYFPIKLYLTDEKGNEKSIVINVEPPRIKTLKKLISFTGKKEVSAEEFKYMITALLNKNKEHKSVDKYVDELSIDQLQAVYTAFMEWLDQSKKEKN